MEFPLILINTYQDAITFTTFFVYDCFVFTSSVLLCFLIAEVYIFGELPVSLYEQ